jgi:hypothetical protein
MLQNGSRLNYSGWVDLIFMIHTSNINLKRMPEGFWSTVLRYSIRQSQVTDPPDMSKFGLSHSVTDLGVERTYEVCHKSFSGQLCIFFPT